MTDINKILEGGVRIAAKAAASIGRSLEETRAPEKLVKALKGAPDFIREFPKGFVKGQGAIFNILERDSAHIRIRADHPDPKIAEVGKAIDEMLGHPLARRFQRNKLHVFIAPNSQVTEEMAKNKFGAWMKMNEVAFHSPKINGIKTIIVPAEHFNSLSPAELKAVIGHEIGHQLRGDAHIRRGFELFNRRTQGSERFADAAGILLSGEPQALKTGLEKIVASQKAEIEKLPEDSFWMRLIKRKALKFNPDIETKAYPSLSERMAEADRLSQIISSPEGRSHVEQLLAKRLEEQHRKLFPHHYDWPSGVTRG
ncbi:MAG: M48 family metalloprotease [Alphaproteobacteria bacterium]|nr:M48 family metalloprotease [Alphaproteobacteria bacterium]